MESAHRMEANYVPSTYRHQYTFLVWADQEKWEHRLHDLLKVHLEWKLIKGSTLHWAKKRILQGKK